MFIEKLIPGWILNSFWLWHLFARFYNRPLPFVLGLAILLVPYLGAIFYYCFFVMEFPQPQPEHMKDKINEYVAQGDHSGMPYSLDD